MGVFGGMVSSLISGLSSLSDAVGVVKSVMDAPEAQKELAGSRLHEAIDEIQLSFEAIESQLVALIGADVSSPEARRSLVKLEGGSAALHLANMRGHCSSIDVIWSSDLATRFQKVFTKKADYQQLEAAFTQLASMDGVLLQAARLLGDGIPVEAQMVLDAIDSGQMHQARDRIGQIRGEVRQLRQLVNRTLAQMVELKFVLRKASN